MTFSFMKSGCALIITIQSDRCPTWEEIAEAVKREYPHVCLGTIPSEAYIESTFHSNAEPISLFMPYPVGGLPL